MKKRTSMGTTTMTMIIRIITDMTIIIMTITTRTGMTITTRRALPNTFVLV